MLAALPQPGQEGPFLLLLFAQKPLLPPRQRRLLNHGRVGFSRLRRCVRSGGVDLLGGRLVRHGRLGGLDFRCGAGFGAGLTAAVAIGFGFTAGF